MRRWILVLLLSTISVPAAAAPGVGAAGKDVVAKWGPFATLAEQQWWLRDGNYYHRYVWVERGKLMRIEGYQGNGTRSFSNLVVMDNGIARLGEPVSPSSRTVSISASTHVDRTRTLALLPGGRAFTVTRKTESGASVVDRYDAVPPPAFAAKLAPAVNPPVTAAAADVPLNPCPSSRAALAQFLRGKRILTSKAEVQGASAGSFVIFGEVGINTYAPADFRYLGARPNSVEVAISGGVPLDLNAMLPGHDPKRYELTFRRSFTGRTPRCNEYGCTWTSREDTWNAPEGALIQVSLQQVITSDTELRFRCEYR